MVESSGENILFGGMGSEDVAYNPSDIEIRHNYIYKPLIWNQMTPSATGTITPTETGTPTTTVEAIIPVCKDTALGDRMMAAH